MSTMNQTFELPSAANDLGGHIVIAMTNGPGNAFHTADDFNAAVGDIIPLWVALQTRLSPSHFIALAMMMTEFTNTLQEGITDENSGTPRRLPGPTTPEVLSNTTGG